MLQLWPQNTREEEDAIWAYKSEPWLTDTVSGFSYHTGDFMFYRCWIELEFLKGATYFKKLNDLISGTRTETRYINWTPSVLTDNDEGVVDVNATKAVGGFADVGASVVCFHLLDLQAHAENTETDPATVDVARVFGPHY